MVRLSKKASFTLLCFLLFINIVYVSTNIPTAAVAHTRNTNRNAIRFHQPLYRQIIPSSSSSSPSSSSSSEPDQEAHVGRTYPSPLQQPLIQKDNRLKARSKDSTATTTTTTTTRSKPRTVLASSPNNVEVAGDRILFYTQLFFGSQRSLFTLQLDTGSGSLAIPGIGVAADIVVTTFDYFESVTGAGILASSSICTGHEPAMNGNGFCGSGASYGSGMWDGFLWEDNVAIAFGGSDSVTSKQIFNLMSNSRSLQSSGYGFLPAGIQGIVGLGPNITNCLPVCLPSFLDYMYETLDTPHSFSLCLSNTTSVFTIGAPDPDLYNSNTTVTFMTAEALGNVTRAQAFYDVWLTGMTLDGVDLTDGYGASILNMGGFGGIVDSGSTDLIIPTLVYDFFIDVLAPLVNYTLVTLTQAQVNALPPIIITVLKNRSGATGTLVVEPYNYLIPVTVNTTVNYMLRVTPGSSFTILGDAVMSGYHTFFDVVEHQEISFSKASHQCTLGCEAIVNLQDCMLNSHCGICNDVCRAGTFSGPSDPALTCAQWQYGSPVPPGSGNSASGTFNTFFSSMVTIATSVFVVVVGTLMSL